MKFVVVFASREENVELLEDEIASRLEAKDDDRNEVNGRDFSGILSSFEQCNGEKSDALYAGQDWSALRVTDMSKDALGHKVCIRIVCEAPDDCFDCESFLRGISMSHADNYKAIPGCPIAVVAWHCEGSLDVEPSEGCLEIGADGLAKEGMWNCEEDSLVSIACNCAIC